MAETIVAQNFRPIGAHTKNAALSSVVTLTKKSNATKLLIQALSKNVSFTLDGSTPDATTGFQLVAGAAPTLIDVSGVAVVKVIEIAASATIQYQWGK
jgi:hypothetical protein